MIASAAKIIPGNVGGINGQATPAEAARIQSGVPVETICRVLGIGQRHYRRIELHGADCYVTAERLRKLLGCRIEVFLPGGRKAAAPKGRPAATRARD